MPDLFDLLIRWWKQIFSLVVITVIVTTIIVLLTPKKYLAAATALPASGYNADKTGVFSQNLQNLYSALGTADDLDMVLGTAHLDTIYCAVADELELGSYYGINKSDTNSVRKAAFILKKRTRVVKGDYGELKVKVWDGNAKRFCRNRQCGHEPVPDTAVRRFWLLCFCSVQPVTPGNSNHVFCT